MSRTSVVFIWALFLAETLAFEEKDMICSDEFCKQYVEDHGCPELSEACRAQNSTHNGVYLPYPDTCNCCPYCIRNLAFAETCSMGSPGMPPPSAICGPRLKCTRSAGRLPTCQYMETVCMKKQKDWDDRRISGQLGMTEVRPKCDDDGDFAPAHCIPGSLCYCLTPEGNRMFGELPFLDPSDEYKMACGCSLTSWKAAQSVNPNFREMALTARCNEQGLYDALQCMMGDEANCFCVNPVTGEPRVDVRPVPVSKLKAGSLPCFDPTIHAAGIYESDCERAQRSWRENSKTRSAITSGAKVYDYDDPKCQADGMFRRVQKLGKEKICVDPSGSPINAYRTPSDAADADTMDCNCARTVLVLKKAGVAELPSCDTRGNFKPQQCHRNQCFCVDCNGDQTTKEVYVDVADQLSCPYVNAPCTASSSF